MIFGSRAGNFSKNRLATGGGAPFLVQDSGITKDFFEIPFSFICEYLRKSAPQLI
jgi:hypothetical protein